MRGRVTQELGRARCLHPLEAERGNRWNNLLARRAKALEEWREVREHDTDMESAGCKWYCQAKETKCGEKGSEQS